MSTAMREESLRRVSSHQHCRPRGRVGGNAVAAHPEARCVAAAAPHTRLAGDENGAWRDETATPYYSCLCLLNYFCFASSVIVETRL